MARTRAQWRRILSKLVAHAEADAQPPQIIKERQCPVNGDAQPPQDINKKQCQNNQNGTKKPDEHEDTKPQVVRVTLRGHDLFLLLEPTADPDPLIKEAEHFDKAISSWEKWGTFETLSSMRGRFVVQYDKKDVNEAGIPRAVIGVTEQIASVDTDPAEEEPEEVTVLVEPRIRLGTPQPEPGKRGRDEVAGTVAAPPAKKACLGPSPYDIDTDTSTDDDDYDQPPDWSEYSNGIASAAGNKAESGSHSKPDEILDTRVTFGYIDIIPSNEYKLLCKSESSLTRPRSYLIRGKCVPEMGDRVYSDIVGSLAAGGQSIRGQQGLQRR
ncbi:hypothetical protein VMCG_05710 [Cytospora schulzeri]|uniref:Uncharacterized protein n=1 Tax=Cytospora schulzeri TaxID=448051 RepID=A0A423WHW7_9PEZI|nr:hypothetical protein VMCG_05710 [Valsa malicola]